MQGSKCPIYDEVRNMSKVKVAVVGAAGYVGSETCRIILSHPQAELRYLADIDALVGRRFDSLYTNFRGRLELSIQSFEVDAIAAAADVAFLALPHGKGMDMAPKLLDRGMKVVDIGADYRLQDIAVFEKWYDVKHTSPELVKEAPYGIPELFRDKIKGARLVSNPGCYPTSAIVPLYPLLEQKLLDLNTIVVDSASGVSGAGRMPPAEFFSHAYLNEDYKAYAVAAHRHMPEIEQGLSWAAGEPVRISFTPHLLPITRGILTTSYANLTRKVTTDDLLAILNDRYRDEFFVRVLPKGQMPNIKSVAGSNFIDIGAVVDEHVNRAIIITAEDNLIKGAAGQAIQNMNIIFDLDERAGLEAAPVFP